MSSASSTIAPPPPPPTSSILDNIAPKLTPSILLIIVIFAIVVFICGLLHLLVQNILKLRRRRQRRRGDADSPTAFQGQLQELFHLHDDGVDQAFIDALPVFLYRSVAGAGKGPFDCAVCLCEFGPDDKLRLLPACGHAFHVPCIDTWLLSHSTCPLCRGSILAELSPASSPVVLVLESANSCETVGDSEPGGRDNEESPSAEEVVGVKLGKLRSIDGNGNAREAEGASSSSGDGKGNLGQRRCLSMGSYEYVMDEQAALRLAIKPRKKKPASSRSRPRGALSECDLGRSKKGAWEMAFTEAASGDVKHCRDNATAAAPQPPPRLKKDSFSVSKIWMVPSKNGDSRTAELAAERRAASFRWPDVEAGSCRNSAISSHAEERPSFARTLLWVVGGRQLNRVGSHS